MMDTCLVYLFRGSGAFGEDFEENANDGELTVFSEAGSLKFRSFQSLNIEARTQVFVQVGRGRDAVPSARWSEDQGAHRETRALRNEHSRGDYDGNSRVPCWPGCVLQRKGRLRITLQRLLTA